jgi:tRNA threonylcarbamoyladenosine biosynthesis protein TsaE
MKKEVVQEYITHSPEETRALGEELGKTLVPGSIVSLSGDLGSGKTLLTRGIARGMGIQDDITSPSFSLLEEYEGDPPLFHFDLYRISGPMELENLFFEEYWDSGGISVIEWPERCGSSIPEHAITVTMEYLDDTKRKIRIEYPAA